MIPGAPAPAGPQRAGPPVGLCASCRHQQLVRTGRGSEFSLCRRSRDEPERYPKYPRLPVQRCPGYEWVTPTETAAGESRRDSPITAAEADRAR